MKKFIIFLILILPLGISLTACSRLDTIPKKSLKFANPVVNRVKDDFNIDVVVSFEELAIDEVRDQVEAYFRVRNSIYPAANKGAPQRAGTFYFECPEISGNSYTGKLAKAPSKEKLTPKSIKSLIFGNFSITPSDRLTTGFNEIDRYGNGTVEMILKLTFKPPVMPENVEVAREQIKEILVSKKISVNYGIMMEKGNGKALYVRIDFAVPDTAFKPTPTFVGTYGL